MDDQVEFPAMTARGILHGVIASGMMALNLGTENREEAERRHAICLTCKYNDLSACSKCGCPIGAKVWIRKEKCPARKW